MFLGSFRPTAGQPQLRKVMFMHQLKRAWLVAALCQVIRSIAGAASRSLLAQPVGGMVFVVEAVEHVVVPGVTLTKREAVAKAVAARAAVVAAALAKADMQLAVIAKVPAERARVVVVASLAGDT